MAFENSQAFSLESKKLAKVEQFECLSRLEVSLDKPIKKVVSVSGLAKVTSLEKNGDSLVINGKTSYQVVYQTEESGLASAFAESIWQQKTEGQGENVYVVANVMENNVTGTSSTEIALSSLVAAEVYTLASEKIAPVENLTEDYVTKLEEHNFYRVVNQVNQTFNEVGEQEFNGRVDEVLSYNASPRIRSVTAGIDTLTFEGETVVNVTALQEGKFVQFTKAIDFKEEIACLSVVPSNHVDGFVNLASIKCTASVNETDNKTNFIIALELNAYATVYSKETNTVIVDTFSTEKNIECVRECVVTSVYQGETSNEQTLVNTVTLESEINEFGFVTSSNCQVTDIEDNQEETLVKGNTELKFIAKNENGEYQEYLTFVPFAVNLPNAKHDDEFSLSVDVKNVRLKGNNELEVAYNIYVTAKMYNEEYVSFISSIEEIDNKEKSEAGIKVFITRPGEDLFNASKVLSVRPEVILEQNPNLTEELESNTRIVVYSGLDVNF